MSPQSHPSQDSIPPNPPDPSLSQNQSLKPCFKCLFTLICINVAIAFCVHIALGFSYGISFFVAQVSSFLVVLSSFAAVNAKLKRETLAQKQDSKANNNTQETPTKQSQKNSNSDFTKSTDETQEDDIKPSFFSSFVLGVQLSFGLYRVLAYLALAVGIIALMDLGFFSVLGYIAGVIVCMCSIVLFQLKGYK